VTGCGEKRRRRGGWGGLRGWSISLIVRAALGSLAPLVVSTALLAAPAVAFATPRITLRPDAPVVEVGEVITITMTALGDGGEELSDPSLAVPSGFSVRGPTVSSQSSISVVNGKVSMQRGFTAVWTVTATKVGTFSIGPGNLRVDGKRVKVDPFTATIRPAGTMSHPKRRPARLFDPFGGLFPSGPSATDPDDDDLPPSASPIGEPSPTNTRLEMDAPLQPQAFLRAIVDKTDAVVGEQVTLSIYLYAQPRFFQVIDPHEANAQDFFQRVLTAGENEGRMVPVGQQTWRTQLIRRVALFPLRAGDLSTGSMEVTLTGSGFRGGGVRGGMVRASKPITIHVTEPPVDQRPKGYAVGDVGSWTLGATVEPRSVPAGGSIAVTVLLKGTGNPPRTLQVPEDVDVTWLEPEIRENVDVDRPKVSANKTFTYVVSFARPGRVDLGDIQLPYWDPNKRAYVTARVGLGSVTVTGDAKVPPAGSSSAGPATASSSEAPADAFLTLSPSRAELGPYEKPGRPLTDTPWFWALLLGAPALVVVTEGLTRAARKARAAALAARASTTSKWHEALDDAEQALAAGDKKKAAGAVERALHAAVEGASGKNIRGSLRANIVEELVEAGLAEELAQAVHDQLERCEAFRFDPEGAGGDDVLADAKHLVKKLSKERPQT
jgi:hypothetical protein